MERIVYRKTLDVHKNGIQFTLQGFETADNMTRKIEINLMASGDTIDLPLEQLTALMYVTTPNATEPSINECTIKDNTIIYDVLPIVEEGITEMQLKLIETGPNGANGVLAAPKFAVEVSESTTNDDGAMQTTTYTALEDAIAKAKGVYDARFIRMEIDSDCMFRVYFADGTVYETDVLKETLLKGEALMSQSYARGDSGIRAGEETDNSLYYSNVSKSASEEAERVSGEATELLEEVTKHGVYTAFSVDFETGEVKYISPSYKFNINKENGELEAIGEVYNPEDAIELMVTEWLTNTTAGLNTAILAEENARKAADDEINALIETLATKDSVNEKIENVNQGIENVNNQFPNYVTKSEFSTFGVDCVKYLEYQEDKEAIAGRCATIESDLAEVVSYAQYITPSDYIIDQGEITNSNGSWKYEKWKNGTIKIYINETRGNISFYQTGNVYRCADITFPWYQELGIKEIHTIIPQVNGLNYAAWGGQGYASIENAYFCVDVFSSALDNVTDFTTNIYIEVTGTWE